MGELSQIAGRFMRAESLSMVIVSDSSFAAGRATIGSVAFFLFDEIFSEEDEGAFLFAASPDETSDRNLALFSEIGGGPWMAPEVEADVPSTKEQVTG